MPYGDDVVRSDKNVQFAELDLLLLIEVPGRSKHREKQSTVPFQFGPLMCRDGVIDGQWMQVELCGERHDVLPGGTVQADPSHPLLLTKQLVSLLQARWLTGATAVHIDRVIDHTRTA